MNETPKVTVLLFCYNQEEYVAESVGSALNQDYNNLTIIISDDCSTDNSYRIAKNLVDNYSGKNKVILNRNKSNLGIGKHFAYIMDNLAEGELVVAFGGDDISKNNRVSRIVEEWILNDKPSLVAHGLEEIDEKGKVFTGDRTIQYSYYKNKGVISNKLELYNYLTFLTPIPYVGAAIAYRLDTYLKFGSPSFYPDYEDHLMLFRSLVSGGVYYFPEVLVKYRRHSKSYTLNPVKPRVSNYNQSFTIFKEKTNKANLGTYRWHQVITQQWLDYIKAINEELIDAEYIIIDHIYRKIETSHNTLLNQDNEKKISYIPSLKTIIYGAGGAGKNTIDNLSKGFEVICVCDSNPLLHGKYLSNFKIISPENLLDIIKDIDLIIIASMYFFEIQHFLVTELGIPVKKIIRPPIAICNSF